MLWQYNSLRVLYVSVFFCVHLQKPATSCDTKVASRFSDFDFSEKACTSKLCSKVTNPGLALCLGPKSSTSHNRATFQLQSTSPNTAIQPHHDSDSCSLTVNTHENSDSHSSTPQYYTNTHRISGGSRGKRTLIKLNTRGSKRVCEVFCVCTAYCAS